MNYHFRERMQEDAEPAISPILAVIILAVIVGIMVVTQHL